MVHEFGDLNLSQRQDLGRPSWTFAVWVGQCEHNSGIMGEHQNGWPWCSFGPNLVITNYLEPAKNLSLKGSLVSASDCEICFRRINLCLKKRQCMVSFFFLCDIVCENPLNWVSKCTWMHERTTKTHMWSLPFKVMRVRMTTGEFLFQK